MKKPPSSSLSSLPHLGPALRRVYHNAYPCLVRGKKSELAKNRDAAAFTEMMAALSARGYTFESIIFNYALVDGTPVKEEVIVVRFGDLIVMVTRPPVHDVKMRNRKTVPQSGTKLEKAIFEAVEKYLRVCSRSQLSIQEEIIAAWERGNRSLSGGGEIPTPAEFDLFQNCDARLKSSKSLDGTCPAKRVQHGQDYRSIGCFIHLPRIEGFDSRLIVSFGMGSLENLIWNRIVRTRFGHWLDRPVFAIAEMDLNGIPLEPVTMHFVENIPVEVLLEIPVEDYGASDAERESAAA